MKESDYRSNIQRYLARIDSIQRISFAPLDVMIEQSLNGCDLQILALRNQDDQPSPDSIHGLIIFNLEPHSIKTSAGNQNVKVEIHHFSTLDQSTREQMFDFALEHIWKLTHCSSIKIHLHHQKDESGLLKAHPSLKQLLQSRQFKWKTVVNDINPQRRYEIMELANTAYQHQIRRSKAQIFRSGLHREDILREPLSIFFSSIVAFGKSQV